MSPAQNYPEMQELQQGMQAVQQQLELLQRQKIELEQLIDTLTELQKTEAGHELLVPFGAGIFVKAKIENIKTVAIHVGANIVLDKDITDALALIRKQSKELQTIEQSMQEELAHMHQQLQFMQISQVQKNE